MGRLSWILRMNLQCNAIYTREVEGDLAHIEETRRRQLGNRLEDSGLKVRMTRPQSEECQQPLEIQRGQNKGSVTLSTP